MSISIDQSTAEFWREIRPDSVIILSDAEAMMESLNKGSGLSGQELFVREVYHIEESGSLAEWILFRMTCSDEELFLLVTIVSGEDLNLAVLYEPDEFVTGDRLDIYNADQEYIWAAPNDPENFTEDDLHELQSAQSFLFDQVHDDGNVVECKFEISSPYPLQAWARVKPKTNGEKKLATLSMYHTNTEGAHSPLGLVLEMGPPDDETTSFIQLFFGSRVRPSEMVVLPA